MPTLAELKTKWFIPMSGDVLGVPCRRHSAEGPEPQLSVSTDGNVVVPLIDGEVYMARWHAELLALHGLAGAEFMHAGWRLEAVRTLGHTTPGNDALEDINDADGASVGCFVLACRNVICLPFNVPSIAWLLAHLVVSGLDNRFPPGGSNHQKLAVLKSSSAAVTVLGSIDISKTRWDRDAHDPSDPRRDPTFGKPTHDTGIAIQGPAVRDIELTYRERWNDSTRTLGIYPPLPRPRITSAPAAFPAGGTHSVQILRTYGITNVLFGYSWSPVGEFTVWASYLNAITKAEQYIYIEDQYFLPWGWPPRIARSGVSRNVDIVFQLGEAMKRGVKIAVVVPSNDEDSTHVYQKYQRDIAVNYLTGIKAAGATGDVVVAALRNGPASSPTPIYVHSKLMIVDDEFVLIGATNIGQRSMTHDGEVHAGIVDSAETFAKDLRKMLWAEHTGRPPASLDAPLAAYILFQADTAAGAGRLFPYPADPAVVYPPVPGTPSPPAGHPVILRNIVDPFAGPPGLA